MKNLLIYLLCSLPVANAFAPYARHGSRRSVSKATTVVQPTVASLPFLPLRMGIMDGILGGSSTESIDEVLGNENKGYLAELQKRVDRINALEPEIEDLGDEELVAKTEEFKQRLANGEDINGPLLEEAFAVVREAAWRVLELRHYDVQILGGLILHDGKLAEMATGEGKTLVATLPAYLNALLEGKSSYVVTVNDYLARRDMEKMGQVHKFLGLSVGLIQSDMKEEERKKQYSSDIVYVTNSELGFDYLRDHLAVSQGQTVLPGGAGEFNGFCIVDEADSVLIDEARTPLIISKQVPASSNKYSTSVKLAEALLEGRHYEVDLKNKAVSMTEIGFRDSENALGIDSLFIPMADGEAWATYVVNAIKAKELFKKDFEYTILTDASGNKSGVGIIDSFTGRVLDGRRWSDGLHQSIEAKEGIAVSEKSKVIAKVTYQSLFRQFSRLSGMTGTAVSDAGEFEKTYGLNVVQVPTALPVARRDYPDVAFKTREAANKALIKEVINVGGGEPDGRPCLIGTTSVDASESLVKALAEKDITAELLNASPKNAPRESEIIAQAGRAGVVTVATNMAGRGTDILLGGCPSTMARIKARSVLVEGGILSSEEAALLPPSPPESYFPCEIGEEAKFLLKDAAATIRKQYGEGMTAIELDELLTTANDATESEEDSASVIKLREAAEAIKDSYEEVLEQEKETVKALGGLYVMGTNRHESSRIDRQLRGRSGRQGDPGSSRFFLSFEDEMFQVFGGDQLTKMLETFRVGEDMPVEAPQVTEAMDKVQEAVEDQFREIRTEIRNFDATINSQRGEIYQKRQRILFGTPEETIDMMKLHHSGLIAAIVKGQTDEETGSINTGEVVAKVGQFFPGVSLPSIAGDDTKGMASKLTEAVNAFFDKKKNEMEATAKAEGRPANPLARSANYITLITMDNAWSDHLQTMEDLKEVVVMKQFRGVSPAQEYRRMAAEQYTGLVDKMRNNAVYSLWQSLISQAAAAQTA